MSILDPHLEKLKAAQSLTVEQTRLRSVIEDCDRMAKSLLDRIDQVSGSTSFRRRDTFKVWRKSTSALTIHLTHGFKLAILRVTARTGH